MYTKRPISLSSEPLRLPEHYSGVAFSRKGANVFPENYEAQEEITVKDGSESKEVQTNNEELCKTEAKVEAPPKKQNTLLGIGGREDILLLILALLLLDDEGGDDMLAYILLGLLFLG